MTSTIQLFARVCGRGSLLGGGLGFLCAVLGGAPFFVPLMSERGLAAG